MHGSTEGGGLHTVAAVSFLNAPPLIDGLEEAPGIRLVTDVPSRLLEALILDRADVALCPVIDFQLSPEELCIVPVGAIGSDGPTLTVRVFSRRPMDGVRRIHVDGDSHTSVALLQMVFAELFGRNPEICALESSDINGSDDAPGAVLLIGDKVVRDEPDPSRYPHQLDLGEAWKELTGLPFVFACWMARIDRDLEDLPEILARRREINRRRIPDIVTARAAPSGWPEDLATQYLGRILRYELGARELESVEIFWSRCHHLGLIDQLRPMRLYHNSQF
jgi:chorismate dehydratase